MRLDRHLCAGYFSASFTLVKVVSSFDPSWPTTVMIAIEMPAAMRPYSMAVVPFSSAKNAPNSPRPAAFRSADLEVRIAE